MNKNNFYIGLAAVFFVGLTAYAQKPKAKAKPAAVANSAASADSPAAAPAKGGAKKKINLDFENDTVMGTYDTPDASFINSRRMIKYKELFNKRTNFIEEIDSNKGLFNEYQK